MSNKLTLTGHSLLVIIDICVILVLITRPTHDQVHGGLGHALMGLYGLGFIIALLVYEGVFLGLYFKKRFQAIRKLWWTLAAIHLTVILAVATGMLT